jgi:hypothetical protein
MAPPRPERKRSLHIGLLIMGAAAGVVGLASIDSGPRTLRNNYSSKEDCEADYAAGRCESTSVDGKSGWYGPEYTDNWRSHGGNPGRYYTWRDSEVSRAGGTAGVDSVAHAPRSVASVGRGGFGGFGRGFSGS